jgi:spore germination cell wall hydrolase CwlJ-like protein
MAHEGTTTVSQESVDDEVQDKATHTKTEKKKATKKRVNNKKKSTKKRKKKVNAKDVRLLAKLITAENGSAEHDETLILTGVVVLKRVKSKHFPDTISGVIYQRGQYSTAPKIATTTPTSRSIRIAKRLLREGVKKYPDNLIYQSMFSQGKTIYRKIDGEYFCLS